MKKTIGELQAEINDRICGHGDSSFDVWYTTKKKQIKKRVSFLTIEELTKWCKKNKNNVNVTSGSWQVFEIMKTL